MKTGKLLTDYLDECARNLAAMRSNDLAQLEDLNRRLEGDPAGRLWRACLDDGWTREELDDAYARRFNVRVRR
jgi:hypothetical protein